MIIVVVEVVHLELVLQLSTIEHAHVKSARANVDSLWLPAQYALYTFTVNRLFPRSMDCKSLFLHMVRVSLSPSLSSTGEGFSKRGNVVSVVCVVCLVCVVVVVVVD